MEKMPAITADDLRQALIAQAESGKALAREIEELLERRIVQLEQNFAVAETCGDEVQALADVRDCLEARVTFCHQ